jgi:hypothetical protein
MTRHSALAPALLVLALLSAAPGLAEDEEITGTLSYALEIGAHRWLVEVLSRSGTQRAPFTTDGCSGGMSSLWAFTAEYYPAFAEAHAGRPPWEDCCVTHDRAYHAGGSQADADASYVARLAADEMLQRCVVATVSERDDVLRDLYGLSQAQVRLVYESIGAAMFSAVRLGGGPCTGLPWRWGYGYPQCWAAEAD